MLRGALTFLHGYAMRTRYELGAGTWIYLLISSLVLVSATFTQRNLLYAIFGVMVGAMVVSLVWGWLSLRGITIHRERLPHAMAGHAATLDYQLRNTSRWFPAFNLLFHESWSEQESWRWREASQPPAPLAGTPSGWAMHLGPGRSCVAQAWAFPQRRGAANLRAVDVSTRFPFGLIRISRRFDQPAAWTLHPTVHPVPERVWRSLTRLDPAGHGRGRRGDGGDEFFGLRPYRVGDSQRRIHWRRTARTGELVSREMLLPTPPHLMLRLVLDSPIPEQHEDAITLAASLIVAAQAQGYCVGLSVRGTACPHFSLRKTLPHRDAILWALAGLPSVPSPLGMGGLTGDGSDATAGTVQQKPAIIVQSSAKLPLTRGGRTLVVGPALLDEMVTQGTSSHARPPGAMSVGRVIPARDHSGLHGGGAPLAIPRVKGGGV